MKIVNKNGLQVCHFENLEKTGLVNHCFTTRIGGVSRNEFESLNVSFTRGDKKENVEENLKRVAEAEGFD